MLNYRISAFRRRMQQPYSKMSSLYMKALPDALYSLPIRCGFFVFTRSSHYPAKGADQSDRQRKFAAVCLWNVTRSYGGFSRIKAVRGIGSNRYAPVHFIHSAGFSGSDTGRDTRRSTGREGLDLFYNHGILGDSSGETAGTVKATCSESGTTGNGFLPGQINVPMDPLPFVQAVTNLTVSSGGAAAETDEAFKERIRHAPESYSTAGPQGAYEFWAKSTSSAIKDVHAYSPAPGRVTVVPLLAEGKFQGRMF